SPPPLRAIAKQPRRQYGDQKQQPPCRGRNPVPPRRLRISLRVENVVHPPGSQCRQRRRLHLRRLCNRGPQLILHLRRLVVHSRQALSIGHAVKLHAKLRISPQQFFQPRRILRGQKVHARILRPNRIRFLFLEVLALVVPRHRHRKRESYDQPKQRQDRALDNSKVGTRLLRKGQP